MQDLAQYALKQFHRSIQSQEWADAIDWVARVPPALHPKELVWTAHAALAREAIARGNWGTAEGHLQSALAIRRDPLLAQRLPMVRHTPRLLDDQTWALFRETVDTASRLAPDKLAPEVTGTYTCGQYRSRNDRYQPWSRFLRIAKQAPPDTDEGIAALQLAGEFLCRVVYEETPLLRQVDVVVAIPANPARFVSRMMSLPDELARALELHFALPFLFRALISDAPDDLKLSRLTWRERHEAIRGSMRAGKLGIGEGRSVLIVDDITTSGATIKEAARILRSAGAGDVFAVTLSHTEG